MDIYTFSLGLGVAGLCAMALGGLGRHAGPSNAQGAGHAAHGGAGHAGASGGAGHAHAPALHGARAPTHGAPAAGASFFEGHFAWLLSPRGLFGIALGLGTAGVVLHRYLDGWLRLLVALAAGVLFERYLLTPLGNLTLRFASRPALTLETAVSGDATAVTTFDVNGQGIVQIDLDGQLVQVLATLTSRDKALGHRVRRGATLRVEDVDPERNHCRVTLL